MEPKSSTKVNLWLLAGALSTLALFAGGLWSKAKSKQAEGLRDRTHLATAFATGGDVLVLPELHRVLHGWKGAIDGNGSPAAFRPVWRAFMGALEEVGVGLHLDQTRWKVFVARSTDLIFACYTSGSYTSALPAMLSFTLPEAISTIGGEGRNLDFRSNAGRPNVQVRRSLSNPREVRVTAVWERPGGVALQSWTRESAPNVGPFPESDFAHLFLPDRQSARWHEIRASSSREGVLWWSEANRQKTPPLNGATIALLLLCAGVLLINRFTFDKCLHLFKRLSSGRALILLSMLVVPPLAWGCLGLFAASMPGYSGPFKAFIRFFFGALATLALCSLALYWPVGAPIKAALRKQNLHIRGGIGAYPSWRAFIGEMVIDFLSAKATTGNSKNGNLRVMIGLGAMLGITLTLFFVGFEMVGTAFTNVVGVGFLPVIHYVVEWADRKQRWFGLPDPKTGWSLCYTLMSLGMVAIFWYATFGDLTLTSFRSHLNPGVVCVLLYAVLWAIYLKGVGLVRSEPLASLTDGDRFASTYKGIIADESQAAVLRDALAKMDAESKPLIRAGVKTAIIFASAAVTLLCLFALPHQLSSTFWGDFRFFAFNAADVNTVAAVAALAIAGTAIPYIFLSYASAVYSTWAESTRLRFGADRWNSLLNYFEPAVATIIGLAVLDEALAEPEALYLLIPMFIGFLLFRFFEGSDQIFELERAGKATESLASLSAAEKQTDQQRYLSDLAVLTMCDRLQQGLNLSIRALNPTVPGSARRSLAAYLVNSTGVARSSRDNRALELSVFLAREGRDLLALPFGFFDALRQYMRKRGVHVYEATSLANNVDAQARKHIDALLEAATQLDGYDQRKDAVLLVLHSDPIAWERFLRQHGLSGWVRDAITSARMYYISLNSHETMFEVWPAPESKPGVSLAELVRLLKTGDKSSPQSSVYTKNQFVAWAQENKQAFLSVSSEVLRNSELRTFLLDSDLPNVQFYHRYHDVRIWQSHHASHPWQILAWILYRAAHGLDAPYSSEKQPIHIVAVDDDPSSLVMMREYCDGLSGVAFTPIQFSSADDDNGYRTSDAISQQIVDLMLAPTTSRGVSLVLLDRNLIRRSTSASPAMRIRETLARHGVPVSWWSEYGSVDHTPPIPKDAFIKLADPNRPELDEGLWQITAALARAFEFLAYHGDAVPSSGTGVAAFEAFFSKEESTGVSTRSIQRRVDQGDVFGLLLKQPKRPSED